MIIVADNIQITNPVVQKAVKELDPEPLREIALKCENAGAEAIDINSGPLPRGGESVMTFLVETVREVTNLPLFLDTTSPVAMEAGLRAAGEGAVINGFSLEPAKIEKLLPLAKRYNADIIGYLLYPNSHVPTDTAGKLGVGVELFDTYLNSGLDQSRLIIDPVVPPVMWQNGNLQALEVAEIIKTLPELFGFPVRTICGISNLTTGKGDLNKKLLLEKSYLPILCASGLSFALMNVFHKESVRVAKAARALTGSGVFTWEEIPA